MDDYKSSTTIELQSSNQMNAGRLLWCPTMLFAKFGIRQNFFFQTSLFFAEGGLKFNENADGCSFVELIRVFWNFFTFTRVVLETYARYLDVMRNKRRI